MATVWLKASIICVLKNFDIVVSALLSVIYRCLLAVKSRIGSIQARFYLETPLVLVWRGVSQLGGFLVVGL